MCTRVGAVWGQEASVWLSTEDERGRGLTEEGQQGHAQREPGERSHLRINHRPVEQGHRDSRRPPFQGAGP